MIFSMVSDGNTGIVFLRKYSKVQLTQTNNLPQAASHPDAASSFILSLLPPSSSLLFFFFHHPQSPEKRTQHLRALFFQHAALDLHLMVKLVHFQHI